MMASDFTLDLAAIGRVLQGQQAVEALRSRAETVVNDAHSGPRGAHPGSHNVDLITVGDTHVGTDGAVVDIDWPSPVWHLIEFGSVNNPPYRPVTRGAQNAGLQVIDKRQSR